ncbi:MAG: hypothetical protein AB7F31_06135 [Parachlamydiales bacterium]
MKRWIRYTFVLLALLTTGAGLLYFYRDPLLLTLTSHQIKSHSRRLFETPLAFREKRKEGGQVIFEEPRFSSGFQAERLILTPKWLPNLRGVHVAARLEGARLTRAPHPPEMAKRLWLAKAFRLKWEFEIEGGELLGIPLSGRAFGEDSGRMAASLRIGEGHLSADYREGIREKELCLALSQVPVGAAAPFATSWSLKGETLDGEITLHLPNRGLLWIEGSGRSGPLRLERGGELLACEGLTFYLAPKSGLRKRDMGKLTQWESVLLALRGEVAVAAPSFRLHGRVWEGPAATLALTDGAVLEMEGRWGDLPTQLSASLHREGGRQVRLKWDKARLYLSQQPKGPVRIEGVDLSPIHSRALGDLLPLSHLGGTLSVIAEAHVKGGKVVKLWVEELVATDLEMEVGRVRFAASELGGHLSLPLVGPGWERECSARLFLEGGSLSNPLSGEGLTCELLVDSGSIERLEAQGMVAGLDFTLSTKALADARHLSLHLAGQMADLTTLYPHPHLITHFGSDPFSLDLACERVGPQISVSGTCGIGADLLPFQCSLAPQKRPSSPLPCGVERVISHLLPTPRTRFPLDIGPAKALAFEGGVIEANRVDAAKFVQPLLKGHENLSIFGTVDLQVAFDGEALSMDYEGYNMRLEGPLFRITVPHTGDLSENAPKRERARHHINLRTGAQGGRVPLKHATYVEKHAGLLFTHLAAEVHLHQNGLFVPELHGECEGVTFVGSVDMDQRAGSPTDLKLRAQSASGPLTGATAILKRISPSPLWELPAKGRAYLKEGGLDLRILFLPEKSHVEAVVAGGVDGGAWESGHGFALTDLATEFTYQHEGRRLLFSDLIALSHFGEGERAPLNAPRLLLEGFPGGSAHFHIGIDGIAHLEGDLITQEKGERRLTLRHSYFGGIRPDLRLCLLEQSLHIRQLKAHPEVAVSTLARDLERLEQITGKRLGSALFTRLTGGDHLSGEVAIDRPHHEWRAHLAGKRVLFRDYPLKGVTLTAHGNGEEWEIAAKGGKLSARAHMKGEELDKGEIHWGSELGAQFSGRLSEGRFQGELLPSPIPLESLPWAGALTGGATLSGPFTLDARSLRAQWNLKLDQVVYHGIHLNQTTPFIGHFSEQEWVLEGLHLTPSNGGSESLVFEVGRLTLRPDLTCDHLTFQIPEGLLNWTLEKTASLLKRPLPLNLPIRKEGGFQGILSYRQDHFRLSLDGGPYQFAGHTLPLAAAEATLSPTSLHVSASTSWRGLPLYANFYQNRRTPQLAELTLSDGRDENLGDPLTLFLQLSPDSPRLTRIEGSVWGLAAKLTADTETDQAETLSLFGSLTLDPLAAAPLLPFPPGKVGGPFQFTGRFELPTPHPHHFTFTGEVDAHHFTAFGLSLDRLHANLFLSPNHLSVHSLALNDPNIRCAVDQIEGSQQGGRWHFQTPLVRVISLQPSLLLGTYKPQSKNKPLAISRGEIHHFSGGLDPASWTGVGSFSFRHPPKREVAGTLFAFPDDLLGILGLDFQSLIPAAGQVHFTIGNGRCTLSRFADVHSRGHRSQFFLADDEPSYVDFSGNLSLRVRTKQYNLMLKITELFTVAIGGTLDKPTFRLQAPSRG